MTITRKATSMKTKITATLLAVGAVLALFAGSCGGDTSDEAPKPTENNNEKDGGGYW